MASLSIHEYRELSGPPSRVNLPSETQTVQMYHQTIQRHKFIWLQSRRFVLNGWPCRRRPQATWLAENRIVESDKRVLLSNLECESATALVCSNLIVCRRCRVEKSTKYAQLHILQVAASTDNQFD